MILYHVIIAKAIIKIHFPRSFADSTVTPYNIDGDYMSELTVEFGKKVRSLRQGMGMSQEELAFKAGLSPAHLGQIERAQKKPTLETIGRLADALGVAVVDLFAFDAPVQAGNRNSETIEKINSQLLAMSEEDRKDILRIIRIFRRSKMREK